MLRFRPGVQSFFAKICTTKGPQSPTSGVSVPRCFRIASNYVQSLAVTHLDQQLRPDARFPALRMERVVQRQDDWPLAEIPSRNFNEAHIGGTMLCDEVQIHVE